MESLMLKAVLILPLLVAPCLAQSLEDSPLAALPRTKSESARIAAVTAPTTDFTKPEPFEAKPAGAASVRGGPTPAAF